MINLSKHPCLILAIALFSSCSLFNNEENNSSFLKPIDFSIYEQDKTSLVNSWEWVSSTYYFTTNGQPTIKTPVSTGSIQKLIVKEDSTIELYINDELSWKRSIDEYLDGKMWGIRADTLAISTSHVDGPESVYILTD